MSSRSISAAQMGPTYHRRGSLQLWQFLLALLNDPANQAAIVWTGRGMEFKLIEPEEVSSHMKWQIEFSLDYWLIYECGKFRGIFKILILWVLSVNKIFI